MIYLYNMNLHEQISRMKSMMNLKEDTKGSNDITLPMTVEGSFNAKNGDELHAFQSTGGKVVGGMQTKVNAELKAIYAAGYNPDVTSIEIEVDSKNLKTTWKATLDKSTDGKAYVGIVTVGSAGGKVGGTSESNKATIKNTDKRALGQVASMRTWNSGTADYTQILDFKNDEEGGIYIRQIFEKYTKPKSYPPHKVVEPETPSIEYEIDPRYTTEPADATRVQNN